MIPGPRDTPAPDAGDKFDDEHYPAYTMGRAAEMLGTTPGFLRSLDEAKLIEPQRSSGGHRRYSRYQLRLAARVRELVDQGTGLDAACRIVILEDQLHEAQRLNVELRQQD
jgi:DNA-binding transcriptional MerR regulator